LRNENDKPLVWEDIKLILSELNLPIPPSGAKHRGRS